MNDFQIIARSLRLRLFSTIVTIASVAIAVGLLMALLTLRTSGEQAFARGTGNAALLVSRDASPLESVLNGIFYANPPRNPIPMEKYEEIAASFPWSWTVPTQLGDSYRGFPVVATNSDFFTQFQPVDGMPWSFQAGRRFARPFELVIGSDVVEGAGLSLGDQVPLT
ncbi:MAG: ABC transporter permease, partial [Planctomycetota bacterium]|nr:ABC transporter permease [Planctomycetota bacterium]